MILSPVDSTTHYRVVFDAARAGYHPGLLPLVGLLLVAVGIAYVRFGEQFETRRGVISSRAWGWFITAFATLWLAATCGLSCSEYRGLRHALKSGAYKTVEGVVTDYTPEGPGGHGAESWSVAGHWYQVSTYVSTSAFGQVGLVRPGARVRIADVNGQIARLEIAP